MILLERFHTIRGLKHFLDARSRSLICRCSWEHSPFWIFACDHFLYNLFGLLMLLVRFRAILRIKPFSLTCSHLLICRCAREPSFLNFRVRSLPILFIWPNVATGSISHNSKTPTIFTRALALVNLPLLPGTLLFQFSLAITSNVIYLAWWCYWCDFAQFHDSNLFRARARPS